MNNLDKRKTIKVGLVKWEDITGPINKHERNYVVNHLKCANEKCAIYCSHGKRGRDFSLDCTFFRVPYDSQVSHWRLGVTSRESFVQDSLLVQVLYTRFAFSINNITQSQTSWGWLYESS